MSGGPPVRSPHQTASVATAPSPNIILCGRLGVCFIRKPRLILLVNHYLASGLLFQSTVLIGPETSGLFKMWVARTVEARSAGAIRRQSIS